MQLQNIIIKSINYLNKFSVFDKAQFVQKTIQVKLNVVL